MYKLLVGIEHFMTGLQLAHKQSTEACYSSPFQFERESPSVIKVLCNEEFIAYWPCKSLELESVFDSADGSVPMPKYTHGETEYYAQVYGQALRDCESHSYKMRGYRTPPIQARDWPQFTPEVIKAMRTKFGADSDDWLANLVWAGDHWYFIKDRIYHGVEPDGYIHT